MSKLTIKTMTCPNRLVQNIFCQTSSKSSGRKLSGRTEIRKINLRWKETWEGLFFFSFAILYNQQQVIYVSQNSKPRPSFSKWDETFN